VELAGHALDSGSLPQHAGQCPHLQVTATLETLQGLKGAPAAELEMGGPIAAETAHRVPASATRRALQARDGGCVWPGCDRPASWSQAHHLQSWAQGGSTDVDNLVLICRAPPLEGAEEGWRLIRTDEGVVALPPPSGVDTG
jgi:hypothetical protein